MDSKKSLLFVGLFMVAFLVALYVMDLSPRSLVSSSPNTLTGFEVYTNDVSSFGPVIHSDHIDLCPEEWSLISVTQPMVGKSLKDFNGTCTLKVAWLFYREDEPANWKLAYYADTAETFKQNQVGLGMWILPVNRVYRPESPKATTCDLGNFCNLSCGYDSCRKSDTK